MNKHEVVMYVHVGYMCPETVKHAGFPLAGMEDMSMLKYCILNYKSSL